jgi:hypothetical protein
MGESTGPWEDLICLLQALSEDEVAAARTFIEELARREAGLQEARVPYVVPAEATEGTVRPDEREHQAMTQLATPEELLDFLASGPPGFLPGELDRLLAEIKHARAMELADLCQPT